MFDGKFPAARGRKDKLRAWLSRYRSPPQSGRGEQERQRELKEFAFDHACDISECRRLEKALRRRAHEFRSLAENLPDNIARWDAAGRYLYVNPTHERTLGMPAAGLIGKRIGEAFPDGRFTPVETAIGQVVASGRAISFVRQPVLAENGEMRIHDVSLAPERDADGKIVSVLGIGRDMTESYRMRDTLAARERELRTLAESSPGMTGSFHLRPDGSVCMPYASPNLWELFGLHPREVVDDAAPLLALNHPDDAQRVAESIAESARAMTLWHEEYRVLHPTRRVRWMESHTKPVPHPDGGIVWHGFVHDITERKHLEERLVASEREFRTLAENSPDIVVRYDHEGRFVYANPAFQQRLGHTMEQLRGKLPTELPGLLEAEFIEPRVLEVVQTGIIDEFERHIHTLDGNAFWGQVLIVPEFDKNGQVAYVQVLTRDISALKAAELHLAKSREQLRALAVQWDSEQEAERKRLAYDVHEGVGQNLMALRMNLQLLAEEAGEDGYDMRSRIGKMLATVDETVRQVREVAMALRPRMLDFGLNIALEWLAGEFGAKYDSACKIDPMGREIHLNERDATVLFRAAEEALAYFAHRDAGLVSVLLEQVGNAHRLTVRQLGQANEPALPPGEKSFGLAWIQEQISTMGGEFIMFTPPPGQGTVIEATLPRQEAKGYPDQR